MKKLLAIALMFIALTPAYAGESYFTLPTFVPKKPWDIADINKRIADTNYIVDHHCSGTLISSELRLILTNFHCIDDDLVGKISPVVSQTVNKEFNLLSENLVYTNIVAFNKEKDVAVLQIKDTNVKLPPAAPMTFHHTRGEDVWIVGNPYMLEASVVKGIISNHNRVLELDGTKNYYLQFSGGIIGGNSGGSLYNSLGEFIGMPSAGFPKATFLGFAIPSSIILSVMKADCLGIVQEKVYRMKKCTNNKLDAE